MKSETELPAGLATVAVVETGVHAAADHSGRYRIALPDGPATLVAWDGHGRVGRLSPAESHRKQGLIPLPDLILERGVALRGRLADSAGTPTTGATLVLRGQGIERQEVTDESGAFAFTGLFGGRYELVALPHRGSLGLRRALTLDGADLDLDLALAAARPLDVKVVAEAGPLPGVWVTAEEDQLRRAYARTDTSGKARLSGLGTGPFEFEVREPEALQPLEIVDYDPQASELTVRVP